MCREWLHIFKLDTCADLDGASEERRKQRLRKRLSRADLAAYPSASFYTRSAELSFGLQPNGLVVS
jgi:hypothetical protein